jgi:hypothetical protein
MLLQKETRNERITKALYSSSNICASHYDKVTKELTITFNNGGQYKYADVSLTDYTRFEMADSQGVIFNSHLKKYKFENLGKTSTQDILDEVNVLKEAEKKAMVSHTAKVVGALAKSLSTYYDTTEKIEPAMLVSLKKAIEDYENRVTLVK